MPTEAVLKWKRATDEDGSGRAETEPKRAAAPPGSPQPAAAAAENQSVPTNAQPVSLNEAQTYTMEVKAYFKHDPHKFIEFCQVIQDRKAQRLDTPQLIARVKELFRGHPHVILGFNVLLRSISDAGKITLPSTEEEPQDTKLDKWQQALVFEHKIQALGKHVHDAFTEILENRNKTVHEVYESAAVLLADHGEVLTAFRTILSDTPNDSTTTILSASPMTVVEKPRSPTEVKIIGGGQRSSKKHVAVRESRSEVTVPGLRAGKAGKVDVGENMDKNSNSDTGDRKGKRKMEEGGPSKRMMRQRESNPSRRHSPAGDGGTRSPAPPAQRPSFNAWMAELMQRLEKCIPKCELCAHAEDIPTFDWVAARKQAS